VSIPVSSQKNLFLLHNFTASCCLCRSALTSHSPLLSQLILHTDESHLSTRRVSYIKHLYMSVSPTIKLRKLQVRISPYCCHRSSCSDQPISWVTDVLSFSLHIRFLQHHNISPPNNSCFQRHHSRLVPPATVMHYAFHDDCTGVSWVPALEDFPSVSSVAATWTSSSFLICSSS